MNFNTVKWQDDTVENLKNCISAKTLGHALLFCGERGTALNLAHAVADGVLCDHNDNGQACGICPSCVKQVAKSHPDKVVITAEKATIGVNEVREFINSVYVRPFINDAKVCIFEDASKLTVQAQNALLKVAEQPPEYCIIIMVAEKEEDLLPTVLSRFKKYTLKIPTGLEVGNYLAMKYPEKRELALFCGKFCEGSPTGAEELLLNDGHYNKRRRLYLFMERIVSVERSSIFDFADYLYDNKDEFSLNVSYMQTLIRDMLYIKQNLPETEIINSDLKDELSALSKKYTVKTLSYLASNIIETYYNITTRNAAFKLSVTNLLLGVRKDDRNSRN